MRITPIMSLHYFVRQIFENKQFYRWAKGLVVGAYILEVFNSNVK